MNFDNAKDLPEGIEVADDVEYNFRARQLHHDDPDFPAHPPYLFAVNPEERKGKYEKITDPELRREHFLHLMNQNRASKSNLFQAGRRHYVKGAIHQDIEGFYIPTMKQPTKVGKAWESTKYRLTVEIMDETKTTRTITYIEFAHTPLREVCKNNERGLGKELADNAKVSNIKQRDIREGINLGHMACAGSRLYDEEIVKYANTHPGQKALLTSASTWLSKHKFTKWVNNLRKRCLEIGPNTLIEEFGTYCWVSLLVVTSNYGNESHLDMSDDCQGITIWSEKNPARINCRNENVDNWYFLFPDLLVDIEGKTYKGFAIPLQHGTVVTWDARLVRHCTAVPKIKVTDAEVFGTYFGVTTKVANHGRAKRAGYRSAREVPKKKKQETKHKTPSHT